MPYEIDNMLPFEDFLLSITDLELLAPYSKKQVYNKDITKRPLSILNDKRELCVQAQVDTYTQEHSNIKWFDIIKQHPNNMARLLLFATKLFGKLTDFSGNKSLIDTKIKPVIDHVCHIQPNIFKQFCTYLQGPAQSYFVTKVQTTLASLTNLPIASKFNEYYHPNGKRCPTNAEIIMKYQSMLDLDVGETAEVFTDHVNFSPQQKAELS